MPQPIILQDQSGLAQGIAGAGSALAAALGQRAQDKRQLHQMGSVGKAFGAVDPDKPINEQLSAFHQALQESGIAVDPQTTMQYFQVMQKGQQEARKGKMRIEDIGAIQEISNRLGPDATFENWVNALAMSGIDPSVSQQFLLNKYRGELLKTREGEKDTATKRLTRDERNQRIKLLESDYKEKLNDLKADMRTAKQEFRDDDVKKINEDIKQLQKQRIEDRKRVVKGLKPLLHGESDDQPEDGGAENDINAILFG